MTPHFRQVCLAAMRLVCNFKADSPGFGSRQALGLAAWFSGLLAATLHAADAPPDFLLHCFSPPPRYAADLGSYRSPLLFPDGRAAASVTDWQRRRQEILTEWHRLMGPWPPLLARPAVQVLRTEIQDGLSYRRLKLEIAAGQFIEGWLLVPAGTGPFPAVVVPFYEPETSIGRGKPNRDFALQLARRGFVTLAIGSPGGDAWRPATGAAVCQPLSYLAYVAANCHTILAQRPEVDARRIGIVGHSYGGKWAMFAACLYEKFACGAWSDPGIAWDEGRPNVNYWEEWYLGKVAGQIRPRGIPTADNPRTGAYKELVAGGHDLHELQALMAPRPFLVSGGAEDPPERWRVLNHVLAVNQLLGVTNRVAYSSRATHDPTPESNAILGAFFEAFLKPGKHRAAGRATNWMTVAKHPVDWLTWGAEVRFRHEYTDNAATLDQQAPNDELNYQRYRARAWFSLAPLKPLTLNARLATESRWYLKPDTRRGAALDELLVDTLNVALKLGEDHPVTLTLGRQDLMFGNLWLFHDGTIRDGSRTDFFDAARLTFEREDWHTVFNLVAFDQAMAADKHFPVVNDQDKPLTEENAHGFFLYAINRTFAGTQMDGYLVYKRNRPALSIGNRGDLYLFGARIERELSAHWKWRTEFAPEFGDRNGQDRRAIGWNNLLTYAFKDAWNNRLHLAHEYLSGDDPGTGADEGFDPVWGRRAQYSELLISTFGAEAGGRNGEWTNLQRLGAGWSVQPTRKLELLAHYYALWANENPLRSVAGYSAEGRFRGHLATGVLKYTFSDHLSGHLWAEAFFPGDYYADPKGDFAAFLRAQLIYRF